MTRKVPFFILNYGQAEKRAVARVIDRNWIGAGPEVASFEQEFINMTGVRHAVAVSNCTAALHLSLLAAGIGPGDEVIVPSLTFVATANAVLMSGARPVFADISSMEDWTLSPSDVELKISSRTRAVIPVHYGGYMADMKAFKKMALQYRLRIIEDSAHAPTASRDGLLAGHHGDFACYSFYANKNLTTGEGGMVAAARKKDADRLKLLRSHCLSTSASERVRGADFYKVSGLGYNYRLSDIQGALGRVQLGKFAADLKQRERLVGVYHENLQDIPFIHCPFQEYQGASAYHVFPVYCRKSPVEMRRHLARHGIQTSLHYPPVHRMPQFNTAGRQPRIPLTEKLSRGIITLPLYFSLTSMQIKYICSVIKKFKD